MSGIAAGQFRKQSARPLSGIKSFALRLQGKHDYSLAMQNPKNESRDGHFTASQEVFNINTAFSRSLGWLNSEDLSKLSQLHVGIIGMGGVGGQYSEILARLGVGRLTLCDPDQFSVENTNRQNECKVSNYGKNKAEVIASLVKDINPQIQVNVLPEALRIDQVDSFCRSIDFYFDALDFFVIDLRIAIFRKMRELGKPAITVAPIGTGAACVIFTKDSMSFDDYFGLHTTEDVVDRANLFLVGLAPTLQHRHYLLDPGRVDFGKRKSPSLPMGVYSCASVAATTLLKIVSGRGPLLAAPWSVHYDAYLMKIKKRYVWLGYRNPFQRLKAKIMKILFIRAVQKKEGK